MKLAGKRLLYFRQSSSQARLIICRTMLACKSPKKKAVYIFSAAAHLHCHIYYPSLKIYHRIQHQRAFVHSQVTNTHQHQLNSFPPTILKMLRQYLSILLATIVAAAMVDAGCCIVPGEGCGNSDEGPCLNAGGTWRAADCPFPGPC